MVRAKSHVEQIRRAGDREQIVFTELPYQVNKATTIEKIADLVREKKIDGISDLRDESDREGIRLREVPLDLSLTAAFAGTRRRIAYERLLLDLIEGDPTLFVRRDEVEAQWEWIDGIRAGWDANDLKPKTYPSGSWGPSAAIALTERDGVTWQDD